LFIGISLVLELDKELIEEEICTRLDGCPIVSGVCETFEFMKR